MADITSMRGVKDLEKNHFGRNHILTATLASDGTVSKSPNSNVHLLLVQNLLEGKTLLWTYSATGGSVTITFGYDEHIGRGKIGHAALTTQATLAGEIHKIGGGTSQGGWSISNESGAWGGMGGNSGKSAMLATVARTMSTKLGIVVRAEKAFSSKGWKRKLQELTRGGTRKMQ